MRLSSPRRPIVALVVVALVVLVTPKPAGHAASASTGVPVRPPSVWEEFGELVAADEHQATVAARVRSRRVEAAEHRSETQRVFVNPDGSFTVEQEVRPARVRQGDRWVAVDTALTGRPDGSVGPIAPAVELSFSGGSGPLARIGRDGKQLALVWNGPLPKPVLDGDTATYPEVLEGVDLRVRAEADGFSEVLVVKTAQAASNPALARIRFGLRTVGVSLRAAAGNVEAVDAAGKRVFAIPAPMMWDSSIGEGEPLDAAQAAAVADAEAAARSAVEPLPGARRAPVGLEVGTGELAVVPDQGFIADPSTRFPVFIDPAVSAPQNERTYVSSGWPTTSYLGFTGDEGVGRCNAALDGNCVNTHVNRMYWDFNVTKVRSTEIISATFKAFEMWAWSCTKSPVELWSTNGISGATTWNNQPTWIGQITERNVSFGRHVCPETSDPDASPDDHWVEFNAKSGVADAAAANKTQMTLMLKAGNESDDNSWKRFRHDAVLSITFNSKPNTPTNRATTPSMPCVTGAGRPYVATATPRLEAKVSDPDGGNLKAEFEWWITGGAKRGGVLTNSVGSGGTQFATIPAGAFVHNQNISWRVRAYDGAAGATWSQYSDWTGWCEMTVDLVRPDQVPTVSSPEYPNDGLAYGSVGKSGWFTFTANGVTDVAKFEYQFQNEAPVQVAASPLGGSAKVAWTPKSDGPNVVKVYSIDRAGWRSDPATYQFLVLGGSGPVGYWRMDEGTGSTVTDDSGNSRSLTLSGTSWPAGRMGKAIGFDASADTALTSGPVMRTDQNFTVSAWVRLTQGSAWHTAVSQEGTRISGFFLQATPTNKWSFVMYNSDSTSATASRVEAASTLQLGVWTHLVAVHEASARQVRLYVNGTLAGTATYTSPWNATGRLRVGSSLWNAAPADPWLGDLDEVRVWDRAVFEPEIRELANQAVLAGQWKLDEQSGTTAADASGNGRPATLSGGASWSGGALVLDGSTGSAATAGPVVRTDQSYSVAAWVRLTAGTRHYTALAQEGNRVSAFYLGYLHETGRWSFGLTRSDVDSPAVDRATATTAAQLNTWTHLAGVYDAPAKQIRLYVNGLLAATATSAGVWHAGGALRIGRAKWNGAAADWWAGAIDDVQAHAGVLNDEAIWRLANPGTVLRGHWKLDEGTGQSAADASGNGYGATLSGGASWGSGRLDGGLSLDGSSGVASTAGPVLRTDLSFTVSAWVRLHERFQWFGAVSQDGTRNSGFYLQYSGAQDRWAFSMATVDADTEQMDRVFSLDQPQLDVWTHLVGIYDGAAGKVRLYVDGLFAGETAHTGAWHAAGPLQIGRDKWHGVSLDQWPGDIDDVRVYQGVLDEEALFALASPPPVLVGHWKLDETSGATAADASGNARTATLSGATSWTAGQLGGALRLDGQTGSAGTATSVVSTNKSFTVSAWVRLTDVFRWFTAVSQDGSSNSGFYLQYSGEFNVWAFSMPTADSNDEVMVRAFSSDPPQLNSWTHLAAIYNPATAQIRLYVNGVLVGANDHFGAWHASGGLQIGRAKWRGFLLDFWPGDIDDVRVWQGALTDDEIFQLATE